MFTFPQFKIQDYNIPVFQVGGSALTNMPANDGVEIVSDSTSDTNLITIFGTKFGTNVLIYETIKMDGTTAVSTLELAWGNVYGFFLGDIYGKNSNVAVGTITVREASGNASIGTLTAGVRSAGTIALRPCGKNIILHNISGNTYVNSNNTLTMVTTNNAFKYTAQQSDDIRVEDFIYLLGDATGSTVQIKVLKGG
jgi:hypothetical protein